ncbi:DUF2125 domain-containing protein [Chelativorans intermedius]|uniref:DUF2125 domain-containing protein n=1 Tax=Chelativorans intermedius TaxID=515947 RepID=A0ABV6DAN0_9HYPH|nr:DUF2125 domain-containing protein [Chelativorans intermedius]MCT8997991.1 DUF2125 domain-containing protein [Chelativorans intermedius]
MTSRTGTGSRYGRRIAGLAAAIVLAVLAYSGAWYYGAHWLEGQAEATLARLNGKGVRAFCEEPQARGYPFRIGLFCRSVFYENSMKGVSLRAGALRSAAQIYQPGRVMGELDGPAVLRLPFAATLEARWESLRASARLARPLPQTLSVEGRQVRIFDGEAGMALATAADLQFHARPQEATDLETAVSFEALALEGDLADGLPPLIFDGRAHLTLHDGVELLLERAWPGLRGRSGTVHELALAVAGGGPELSLSGPVTIGPDGQIDAELAVKVSKPERLAELVSEVFPQARKGLMAAAAVFRGLGDVPLPVRIVRGRVFVGIVPVGRIPPVG